MPSYRFKFYDPNSRSEKFGAAVLADDAEAVAFAQRVVRELVRSDEELYATWIVKITEKERTVASMPFATDAAECARPAGSSRTARVRLSPSVVARKSDT
jgi:hypothetical protein